MSRVNFNESPAVGFQLFPTFNGNNSGTILIPLIGDWAGESRAQILQRPVSKPVPPPWMWPPSADSVPEEPLALCWADSAEAS